MSNVARSLREKQDTRLAHSRHLKDRYGITLEDYDTLVVKQDGRCAICQTTNPGGRKGRFCIDHDHITGKIRGLLCSPCNRALGGFHDDPRLLQIAAEYLRQSTQVRN
jgi:hypothetical protein